MPSEEDYIQMLQMQIQKEKLRNEQQQMSHASTVFNKENSDENLIKFQLDIKEELQRIERLLRKLVPKYSKERGEYFINPPESEQLFNERGVNEILNLLAWYLNKSIILSNFKEEEIKIRMKQLARTLKNFIFNNYEDFGLDTKDKIKYYPLIVLNVINVIEASYNRALNGGERESLRTARTVTQNEPLGNHNYTMPNTKTGGIFGKFSKWING